MREREGRKINTTNLNVIRHEEYGKHYPTLLTDNRDEFKGEFNEILIEEDPEIERISLEEVKRTLEDMKNGKAAGP